MAQLSLTRFFLLMFFASISIGAHGKCESVVFKSEDVEKTETTTACFLQDPTYFISENCEDLSCSFIKSLKKTEHKVESGMRPGAILCEALNGVLETVTYFRVTFPVRRCLFPKDRSFISLNYLESWDGERFRGPSIPDDL